jgi:hypothetical protein
MVLINTNPKGMAISPPPHPSPLEGEGRVGGKMNYFVSISLFGIESYLQCFEETELIINSVL